jgi:hypothetical protein
MGTGKLGNLVHTTDLALRRNIEIMKRVSIKSYYDGRKFGGTGCYASITNHLGIATCDPVYNRTRC